ncbi:inorganic diphosphatase [Gammaproteobacteria bacterium]|nr:inorganic diphosphatase [Gammaproteobacteria bacterium]
MNLSKLSCGKDTPNDINVVIEISAQSSPVKYEVDKITGMLMVDRFIATSMFYPCDYGYVPNTLSEDGDPVDVLVIAPQPLQPGSVINCRPVGMLRMTDESGFDAKILAVPVTKLTPKYKDISKPEDLGKDLLSSIEHFFKHYKDLEEGKWVETNGWGDDKEAKNEIIASIARFKEELSISE